MAERSHLSIGEVLSLLREEFPDVTISKIRFLESQGLVDPERTPSGYRKFYDPDVERLRWILRQQRENFLPLKVIRGRLTEQEEPPADVLGASSAPTGRSIHASGLDGGWIDDDPAVTDGVGEKTSSDEVNGKDASADSHRSSPGSVAAPEPSADDDQGPEAAADPGPHDRGVGRRTAPVTATSPPAATAPLGRPPTVSPSIFADLRSGAQPERAGRRQSGQGTTPAAPTAVEPSAPPATATRSDGDRASQATVGRSPASGVTSNAKPTTRAAEEAETYSAEELAATTGASDMLVAELKQYGLITAHAIVAGSPYYDDSALAVARVAAELAQHGVEVRHLRIWRNVVDRETDLFQQIVLPLLRQRNPQSRRQATETLAELARLGGELRSALIERAIHEIR